MNARITVILFLISALGLFIIFQKRVAPASLCGNLRCISFSGKQTYTQKDIYTDTSEAYRALYSSSTHTLRIEALKISADQSDEALKAAVTRMKALFEKAPAPYPGEISDTIVCDPDYIPVFREATSSGGSLLSYFTGYLNERLTFGSCSENQAIHKGLLAYLYCPASTLLIKLELIQPTAEFNATLQATEKQLLSVTCSD